MLNPLKNSDLSPARSESPGTVPTLYTENGLRVGLSKVNDTYYFSHDYNARTDEKIKRLIRKYKMEGYGIFWAIVEDLYNNANALHTDYEGIAFDLHTNSETVKSIINDFDLFVVEGNEFGSLSVENRLSERNNKSEKARQSAFKRWNKSERNANAMQTHSDSNAIKERKGKEIKYIYSDFYDKELKASEGHKYHDNYLALLNYIFGIKGDRKFVSVLKLRDQLLFSEFVKLMDMPKPNGATIKKTIEAMENYKPLLKHSQTIYRTILSYWEMDAKRVKK